MQLDYTLSGYTFLGLPITSAIFHIQSFAFDNRGNISVNVQIYFDLASMQSGVEPLLTTQYNYAATDGQTIAQVWASLLVHAEASIILAGGTLVSE